MFMIFTSIIITSTTERKAEIVMINFLLQLSIKFILSHLIYAYIKKIISINVLQLFIRIAFFIN